VRGGVARTSWLSSCLGVPGLLTLGVELRLVGRAVEVKERKVVVDSEMFASDKLVARGHAVLVLMPETMAAK